MKRVLSLAGGGIRALLTIQVLKYIEHKTGRSVSALFDVIAGTSTGAICAVGLTSSRLLSPMDLEQLYLREAKNIFDRRFLSLGGLTGPKYNCGGLEKALQSALGGYALMDAHKPTLVTAYDLKAREPVFLSSWGQTRTMAAWQAARASSAAPTFFEPYHNLVDGGLVQNSPALSVTIEACKLFNCTVRDVLCLSLGTGITEVPIDTKAAGGWGPLGWVQPVLSCCMDGSVDLVDQQMRDLLPDANYLHLDMAVNGPMAQMDNVTDSNLLALRQAGNQLVATNMKQLDAFIERLESEK